LTKQARIDGTLDSSLNVAEIMNTWTLQKGYPVVDVNRTSDNKLHLSQKWFLLNPQNKIQFTSEYDKYRWYIPFTYTTKEELDFDFEKRPTWFKKENKESMLLK